MSLVMAFPGSGLEPGGIIVRRHRRSTNEIWQQCELELGWWLERCLLERSQNQLVEPYFFIELN
jgi:hypothetical protein